MDLDLNDFQDFDNLFFALHDVPDSSLEDTILFLSGLYDIGDIYLMHNLWFKHFEELLRLIYFECARRHLSCIDEIGNFKTCDDMD